MAKVAFLKSVLAPEHFLSAFDKDGNYAQESIYLSQPEPVNNGGDFSVIATGTPNPTHRYKIELVVGGDLGVAAFKYSIDNGVNYLGNIARDNSITIYDSTNRFELLGAVSPAINIIIATYIKGADAGACAAGVVCSIDGGVTWGSLIELKTAAYQVHITNPVKLNTGRIVAFISTKSEVSATLSYFLIYSDNNGVTWFSKNVTGLDWNGFGYAFTLIVRNTNVLEIYWVGGGKLCRMQSFDNGITWADYEILASTSVDSTTIPGVIELPDGSLLVAYKHGSDSKVYVTKSTDNGGSWNASVVAIDEVVLDSSAIGICRGPGDRIIITAVQNAATRYIRYVYSDDYGVTWSSPINWHDMGSGKTTIHALSCLLNGTTFLGIFADSTDYIGKCVKDFVEGAYVDVTDSIPCAWEQLNQVIFGTVAISWRGTQGVVGDSWTFGPEYLLNGKNLLVDSASAPWRTPSDNKEVNHISDLGANRAALIDAFCLHGVNGIEEVMVQATNDVTRLWGPNLVSNWNMEHGGSVSVDFWPGVGSPTTASKETVYIYQGINALRVQHGSNGNTNYRRQSITLEANGWYYIEAYAKGRTVAQTNIRIGFESITGGYVDTASLSTSFTKISTVFQNTGAAGAYYFVLRKTDAAAMDIVIDAVKVHKVPDANGYTNKPFVKIASFVKLTGYSEASPVNNHIYAPTLLTNIPDHSLRGLSLKFIYSSVGLTRDGYCYLIIDNIYPYIILDNDDVINYIDLGTRIAVLESKVYSLFESGATPCRYIVLTIGAQRAINNYYSIRLFVPGKCLQPTTNFAYNYSRNLEPNVEVVITPGGQRRAWQRGEDRPIFEMLWPVSSAATRDALKAFFQFVGFGASVITLIPNPSNIFECHPVRLTTGFEETFRNATEAQVAKLKFEGEIL